MSWTKNYSLIIAIFSAIFFYVSSSTLKDVDRRKRQLPADWRSRLTDEAYFYDLMKFNVGQQSLFEGDIRGVDRATDDHQGFYLNRNAIVDKSTRWTQGIVPYEISAAFTSEQRQLVEEALRDIMAKTCIRFTPRRSERDYITFINRGLGCSSYVARTGGQQMIDLMPGCLTYIGETQHEVMHALGFFHEQSRTDRDQYVTIAWNNLIEGAEDQFKTYRTDNLDMPYDYQSIMHYGWNYFSKDRSQLPTIIPKTSTKVALGSRKVMSAIDVEKINRLYECPPRTTANDRSKDQSTSTRRSTVLSTIAPRPQGTPPAWNRRPSGTPPSWNVG